MKKVEPYDIQYCPRTKQVIVFFRGKRQVLPGPYETEEQGREAGRQYLRKRGWEG